MPNTEANKDEINAYTVHDELLNIEQEQSNPINSDSDSFEIINNSESNDSLNNLFLASDSTTYLEDQNTNWINSEKRYGGITKKRRDENENWEYKTKFLSGEIINESFKIFNNKLYWWKRLILNDKRIILELSSLNTNKEIEKVYKLYEDEQLYYNDLTTLDTNTFQPIMKNEPKFFEKYWKPLIATSSHLTATGILMNRWMGYNNLWVFNPTSLTMRLWGAFGGLTNALLPENYHWLKVGLTFVSVLTATGGETTSFNCGNWISNSTMPDYEELLQKCLENPFLTTWNHANANDLANIYFNHITGFFTPEGVIALILLGKRIYDLVKKNDNPNILNNSVGIALRTILIVTPFNILCFKDILNTSKTYSEFVIKTLGVQCATVGAYIGLGNSISDFYQSIKSVETLLSENAKKEANKMTYESLLTRYDFSQTNSNVQQGNSHSQWSIDETTPLVNDLTSSINNDIQPSTSTRLNHMY